MKSVFHALANALSIIFLLSTTSNAQTPTPLAANGRLKVINRQLCNEAGTPIQLRGMSTHGLQWYEECFTAASVQTLANSWGCDLLRASMYINEDGYLIDKTTIKTRLDSITDQAARYGMYSIIDWHMLDPGNPNIHTADAIEFFRQEAQRNAGKKSVIYEICNEPSGVTWDSIKKYAEQIIPVIRQYDHEAIILVGTPEWSGLPGDITANPLTGANVYNVMYTFHFYAGSDYTQNYIDGVLKTVPVFVSEWGTSIYTGDTGNDYVNTQQWLNLMAGNNTSGIKVSWCNWNFSDKSETSAVLDLNACSTGSWNNTSESGGWVRNHILSPADSWGTMTTNLSPAATLSSPLNNAQYTAPASIALSATASDADGTVSKVEFYNGTQLLATKTAAPYTFTWTNVPQGIYSIRAKATDNKGISSASTIASVTVLSTPPSVSITSPAANAQFNTPTSITISATATDADGTISKVDFYNGTILLGTITTAPYTFNWTNIPSGIHSLTAIATDNNGVTTTSKAVSINVVSNPPPSVAITSPIANAQFKAPTNIVIAANATDADGTITKVVFYNGTTLLATVTAAPYTFTWTNVPVGTYSLTAVATDNKGLTTTSTAVSINVFANTGPSVALTSPVANAQFKAPASIAITANATDADGTVTKVAFYRGTTLLGTVTTAPYTFNWTNVAIGTYSLTAKATDNNGVVTTSTAVSVNVVANTGPSVALTSPVANAQFKAPASIAITANATDADGTVTKVAFYRGTTLLGTVTTAPYTFNWTNVAIGTYSLTAKATDNNGVVTTSTAISVKVVANLPPSVSITSPVANAQFNAPANIAMAATATDAGGTISKVDFYNGTTLLRTVTAAPYTFNWTNVPAGTYSLTAKATDNSGATTTSTAVSVTVKVVANLPPSVSITSPVANTQFNAPANIAISATATDANGTISKVDFYNGTTLLGSKTTAPYTFNWTNVPAGTYSLTAKATDNSGATTTSTAVSVTVKVVANLPPSVSITSPVANTQFNAPANIAISATATDANGTISKVDFYNGTTLLGSKTAAPYTFNWTNVPVGTYSLTAKATDNSGATTTSTAVSVTVKVVANLPPSVSITSPVANTQFNAPANIAISATATDANGTISKVDFYNGTTLLRTVTAAPYTFNWTNVPVGTYSLTAKATDNSGATTTSTAVSVSATSTAQITGSNCVSPNNTVTYSLNNAYRLNATNYTWSYSGAVSSITPVVGQPWAVNMRFNSSFSGGSVCVGVNYNQAPYVKYCKTINLCTSANFIAQNTDNIVKISSTQTQLTEAEIEIETEFLGHTPNDNRLKVYPNPVSDVLIIETTEARDYQILNLLGQQILVGKTTQRIDVSVLPQGTYFLKIGAEQVKFVKQ